MLNRKRIFAVLTAASLTALAVPAMAKTDIDVFLNFGPPALRYESVPAPRVGFVWTPGYWDWRGNAWIWIAGHYVRERPGYYWHAPQWVQGSRGWYSQPGRWDRQQPVYYSHGHGYESRYRHHDYRDYRDNDRDGIPNYRDATPNGRYYNHGRYGGRYDSDRDGIPNYRDRLPHDRDNDGRPDRWDRRPYDPRR
ncbi:MAG: hypothetical protein SF172_00275 [Burkholderiales bacterium]|nr:hypothetical protein [Burkholderiales bacterium]